MTYGVVPVVWPRGIRSPRIMTGLRLLLVTDQWMGSRHSAIDGVFGEGIPGFSVVQIVEFSREIHAPLLDRRRVALPSACRHRGLSAALARCLEEGTWDFVVVRNLIPVLRQILRHRPSGARVGFWHSFPHSYRRIHEARREGRAVIRKRIEYAIRSWNENRLLRQCDFMLPITATMQEEFHQSVHLPWIPLPMGVDPARVVRHRSELGQVGRIRVAYCGAMDSLRSLDVVIGAVADSAGTVTLDLFGDPSAARSTGLVSSLPANVRLMGHLPRADLFVALLDYDAGLSAIPDERLFRVSSPTKSMEYAALGLVPIVTPVPEHLEVFDQGSAVFCTMDRRSISGAIERLAVMPPEDRARMASRARARVMQLRSYRTLAANLSKFLQSLMGA